MKVEHIHEGKFYRFTNEDLLVGDLVFPIAHGHIIEGEFYFWEFDFRDFCSGFPDEPHTILDLKYSDDKAYEVRTSHGFGPKEIYFKLIDVVERT